MLNFGDFPRVRFCAFCRLKNVNFFIFIQIRLYVDIIHLECGQPAWLLSSYIELSTSSVDNPQLFINNERLQIKGFQAMRPIWRKVLFLVCLSYIIYHRSLKSEKIRQRSIENIIF